MATLEAAAAERFSRPYADAGKRTTQEKSAKVEALVARSHCVPAPVSIIRGEKGPPLFAPNATDHVRGTWLFTKTAMGRSPRTTKEGEKADPALTIRDVTAISIT